MRPAASDYHKQLRLFEVRSGITFSDCLHVSTIPEMVSEFDRLNGTNILGRQPEDPGAMEEFGRFADFVYEYIFMALPEAAP